MSRKLCGIFMMCSLFLFVLMNEVLMLVLVSGCIVLVYEL